MEFPANQIITIRDEELRQPSDKKLPLTEKNISKELKKPVEDEQPQNMVNNDVFIEPQSQISTPMTSDKTNEQLSLEPSSQKLIDSKFSLLNGNRGRKSQFLTCKTETGCVVFYCTLCSLELDSQKDLKEHVKRFHHAIQISICPKCEKVFCRKSALSIHMRIHLDLRPFECTICQKSFRVASHLRDHVRVHTGERPFTCKCCGKGFKQTSDLRKHTFTHAAITSNIRCRICRFRSHSHKAVMDHFKKSHGVIRLNEGQCCCRNPSPNCTSTNRNADTLETVKPRRDDETTNRKEDVIKWNDIEVKQLSKLQNGYPSMVQDQFQKKTAYPHNDIITHQLLLIQGNSQHYLPIDLPCKERAVVVLQQRTPANWQMEEPNISIICSDNHKNN